MNEIRPLNTAFGAGSGLTGRGLRERVQGGRETAMRTVLVIGGAGYVGCPVVAHLLDNGMRVRVLDLFAYGHQAASFGLGLHPNYQFEFGDMGDDATLDRALDGVSDVVILGGLVGDPITKKFPDESHQVNDLAVTRCIDRLKGRGLDRVIFVSTCSNYGLREDSTAATEESELRPLSAYARSKVAAEQFFLSHHDGVDYTPTVLRFATAFGYAPRMRFDLTVNEFTRELWLDRELVVFDADTWRPYCHVQDFARLIRHVLLADRDDVAYEVFNAGADHNNHTKQQIVDLLLERLPNRRVSYRSNSSDPRNYRVSFDKLKNKLGFVCNHTVADGIDEIIAAMASHLFDDVDARPDFYGNYTVLRASAPTRVAAGAPAPATAG